MKKPINILSDPVAERSIISALLSHGSKVYWEVVPNIKSIDFFYPENRVLFSCLEYLFVKENLENPSKIIILNALSKDDKESINKYALSEYLDILLKDTISIDSLKLPLKIVATLSFARKLHNSLKESSEALTNIKGNEGINEILVTAEKPIIEATLDVVCPNNTVQLTNNLSDYVEYLSNEQMPMQGVPTGFPRLDSLIGGGLRTGIHVIGGRAKSGKSTFCLNAANSMVQHIPVLYLDTELNPELIMSKWLGINSTIPVDEIESGRFAQNEMSRRKIQSAVASSKDKPFFYHNIAGQHYQESLSIARKWILKHVKLSNTGKANRCVIILDYIKLMDLQDAGNFAEHQYIGQLCTDWQNFANQYGVPVLAGVQLNRDGILREDQGVVAGSDKIIHLCSSFSILKHKTNDDFSGDPIINGDRKLIPLACRYGPGIRDGEYINIKSDLSRAIMREGRTNVENRNNNTSNAEETIEV